MKFDQIHPYFTPLITFCIPSTSMSLSHHQSPSFRSDNSLSRVSVPICSLVQSHPLHHGSLQWPQIYIKKCFSTPSSQHLLITPQEEMGPAAPSSQHLPRTPQEGTEPAEYLHHLCQNSCWLDLVEKSTHLWCMSVMTMPCLQDMPSSPSSSSDTHPFSFSSTPRAFAR